MSVGIWSGPVKVGLAAGATGFREVGKTKSDLQGPSPRPIVPSIVIRLSLMARWVIIPTDESDGSGMTSV